MARAYTVYGLYRALLFVVSALVLALIGVRGLPLALTAILLCAVLSLIVLRPQRDALIRATTARSAARADAAAARRARLDTEA